MTPEEKKEMLKIILAETAKTYQKRVGDTPTDALQLTPRKYVNLYSSVASLPQTSIIGQFAFITDAGTGSPAWRRQDGKWVNGIGSVIA